MAAYAIVTYATPPQNTVAEAQVLLDTYLTTKDSTANPVVSCSIVKAGSQFVGQCILQGT